MGRLLGIDFSRILVDFGSQVEPSWHGKSSQDQSKNPLKTQSQKEGFLEASWRRLGVSLAPKNPRVRAGAAESAGGGGYAEAPLKDSLGFLLDILMYILGISLEIGRLRRI